MLEVYRKYINSFSFISELEFVKEVNGSINVDTKTPVLNIEMYNGDKINFTYTYVGIERDNFIELCYDYLIKYNLEIREKKMERILRNHRGQN